MSSRNRIGRNDPCPCESGKKFKKCCMGKAEEAASTAARLAAEAEMEMMVPPLPDEAQLKAAVAEMEPALTASAEISIEPPFNGEEWATQRLANETGKKRFVDYYKSYRMSLFGSEGRLPAWVAWINDVATEHAEKNEEGKRNPTDRGVIDLLGIVMGLRENQLGIRPHQCFEMAAIVHDFAHHYLRTVLLERKDEAAKSAVMVVQMGLSMLDSYMLMWLIDAVDAHFGIRPGATMVATVDDRGDQEPAEPAEVQNDG